MLLRAWTEGDGRPRLRVRCMPLTPGGQSSIVCASGEEAVAVVRNWLAELIGDGPSDAR